MAKLDKRRGTTQYLPAHNNRAKAMKRFLLLLYVSASWSASPLWARDVFVMLSGGVSPFNNNYSQYLQARAMNEYFEKHYPANSVWTFFGAGNVEGKSAVLCDVRREVDRDGMQLNSWIAGPLPHNRPATRENVLRAFREEILPAVAKGGTLYLYVGDHGSRSAGTKDRECVIDLWGLKPDSDNPRGWRSERETTLGVKEFRQLLASGIGKGKVVFCMTQCYSGGFHGLGLPDEMTPNKKWFTRTPEWTAAMPKAPAKLLLAAGFTATDGLSTAAGCDPSPDADGWAGYERYHPEGLLGVNLMTDEIRDGGCRSFAEAHERATLVDQTIDKPRSTSDEFLARWATLIETKLTVELKTTSKVRQAVAAYQRTVDGATPKISDPAFRERQQQFQRFVETMGQQNSGAKSLLKSGTRRELESAIGIVRRTTGSMTNNPGNVTKAPPRRPRSGTAATSDTRRVWRESLSPAWAELVKSGEATNLMSLPLEFEMHLLKLERGTNNYFFGSGRALQEEGYWFAGHARPATLDHAGAEIISRWTLERRSKILAWAESSDNVDLRSAAKKMSPRRPRSNAENSIERMPPGKLPDLTPVRSSLSRKTAAERALFYRRVLGAWEFLLAVNERPALNQLRELIALESTPLPRIR